MKRGTQTGAMPSIGTDFIELLVFIIKSNLINIYNLTNLASYLDNLRG